MNGLVKISILSLILALAIGYSLYEKKKLDSYFEISSSPILKSLPLLDLKKFSTEESIDLSSIAKASNGLIVHFWGTWCAPCEYELPEFIEFSESLKELNIVVVLLAVNDDDLKIKKFMKRFKHLSENIILIHDLKGLSMKSFGVVKVPETFLFSRDGVSVNKFVGPQNWTMPSYKKRIKNYLSL